MVQRVRRRAVSPERQVRLLLERLEAATSVTHDRIAVQSRWPSNRAPMNRPRALEIPHVTVTDLPHTAYVEAASTRGYVGIGVYNSKYETNIGTLVRSAHAMGGTFAFTVGRRYDSQPSAVGQDRHIPVFNFGSVDTLAEAMPPEASLVCVELDASARPLHTFVHPEQAVYLLGAEDHGLPATALETYPTVQVPSEWSLNVATAGSLVLYDRLVKQLDASHHGPVAPEWWTR